MESSKSQKAIYVVISVLIAVVFWLYVDNTVAHEQDVRLYGIPVTFVGETDELAERGLMLVSGGDTKIDLRLQGRRQVVSKISRNNIRIQADVRSILTKGNQTLDYTIIYPSNVSPSSVTVVSASMYKIPVEIGELYSKTVPVVADVNGTVADGYILRECQLSPQTLTISGTEEDVSGVERAVVSVTVNKETASYNEYLDFRLLDAAGNAADKTKLRCSEDKVRVDVPIVTLKEVPLTVAFIESDGSRLENIEYSCSVDKVTLSGEKSTLEKLEEIEVAQIDLSQVLGDDTLEYDIPIPSGCINESSADTVRVNISFRGMQTETYECTNISFANVTEGYAASAITQSVNVTLRGKPEALEKITAKNIRMVVDLSDMSFASGTYTARARVYVDGTADAGAIGVYQISYRLQRT